MLVHKGGCLFVGLSVGSWVCTSGFHVRCCGSQCPSTTYTRLLRQVRFGLGCAMGVHAWGLLRPHASVQPCGLRFDGLPTGKLSGVLAPPTWPRLLLTKQGAHVLYSSAPWAVGMSAGGLHSAVLVVRSRRAPLRRPHGAVLLTALLDKRNRSCFWRCGLRLVCVSARGSCCITPRSCWPAWHVCPVCVACVALTMPGAVCWHQAGRASPCEHLGCVFRGRATKESLIC